MFHQVEIIGWLSKDPEIKYFDNGQSMVVMSVVVDKYKSRQKQPVWFTAVAYDRAAKIALEMCRKGTLVRISGELMPDEKGAPKIYQKSNGVPGADYEILVKRILVLTPKSKGEEEADDLDDF